MVIVSFFDYETTRHETRHTHARDTYNVPTSTDGAPQLLILLQLRWDVFANSVRVVFLFVIQVGWLERKIFTVLVENVHSYALTHTATKLDSHRRERVAYSAASKIRRKRARERDWEWMLIVKHVDFSMCLLSTFRLFSQMPYIPRPECTDKNGCVYNNKSSSRTSITQFAFCLFLSAESVSLSLSLNFPFRNSLSVCILSSSVLNVIKMNSMSLAQKCS